ncbi:MAG: pyrroline-5-carboxylate reductase [Desulfarculaceae bacterium]|nr:pyrroline-5-carboxylate reductase [Desulfarculaceae bacterium]MCF8073316.1 pyrroline-5-carboxylate reductase [Desulfarculaceae bacterium]MCF8103248.1 pyrroline-5-carboxylate reductase [Desulfarculaceae bacterium]MCF8116632.1 pyrroline-5-carboxylate reductase [Desulfarculaceae bacterium]
MALKGRIGLVGGGNMGSALLKGMLGSGLCGADQVVVAEKLEERAGQLRTDLGVSVVDACSGLGGLEVLILAVKPADMAGVAQAAAGCLTPDTLVITLAAGVQRASVAEALPADQPLVRAMPNTPALIGHGITAICGGPGLAGEHLETARLIFGAVGPVVVVEEKLMDAVTAVSGSGPAYVFIIIEALSDAGVNQGLDRATSLALAAHTVAGAARLLIESGQHPGELKDMVTSPGGTTIAGLAELERGGLRAALYNAVEAATGRGKSLGKK